jgi:hypothetical protein
MHTIQIITGSALRNRGCILKRAISEYVGIVILIGVSATGLALTGKHSPTECMVLA